MPISDIYKFPLFHHVERSLIEDLIKGHSVISYPEEMQLIRKGVFNNRVFILLEGSVSIRDKNDKTIKTLESGSIFGEISVLDSKPASATVMTQSHCKAFVLKEHELWELTKQSHPFTSNLLKLVVERLRSFSSQLDQYKDNTKNMQKKAYLDASTGLFNRTWLNEKAPQIIKHYKEQSTPISFIMTDIDHFKAVNDSHGHDIGDLVLKQVALILQSVNNKRAYTIRLGGDEMCVILPKIELKEAVKMTNKVRLEIEKAVFKFSDNQSLKVTSSFGVSFHTEDMSIKELMKQADIALYEAKESGRNKVVSFEGMKTGVA